MTYLERSREIRCLVAERAHLKFNIDPQFCLTILSADTSHEGDSPGLRLAKEKSAGRQNLSPGITRKLDDRGSSPTTDH